MTTVVREGCGGRSWRDYQRCVLRYERHDDWPLSLDYLWGGTRTSEERLLHTELRHWTEGINHLTMCARPGDSAGYYAAPLVVKSARNHVMLARVLMRKLETEQTVGEMIVVESVMFGVYWTWRGWSGWWGVQTGRCHTPHFINTWLSNITSTVGWL